MTRLTDEEIAHLQTLTKAQIIAWITDRYGPRPKGRPKTDTPTSSAERMRRLRAKKKP